MASIIAVDVIIQNINRRSLRRQRIFRDRLNPFDYSDDVMLKYTRFDRRSFTEIVEMCKSLERKTKRSNALPLPLMVYLALRYYASGTFHRVTASLGHVSKTSISYIIRDVSKCISINNINQISFSANERVLDNIKDKFYLFAKFPQVVGAIDCTLISIRSPYGDQERYFVGRKSEHHTINVQAICDANKVFLNVVAKFPGATHDEYIWKNSSIQNAFENNKINGVLVGDSGYKLRNYMMTPFLRPASIGEELYKNAHAKTRRVIECAFGELKQRFRCLDRSGGEIQFPAERCCNVIMSCFILHNIAVKRNLPLPTEEINSDININLFEPQSEVSVQTAIDKRQSFVNHFLLMN